MAQYNYLNLPGLHRAAQGAQMNKLAYERAGVAAEREDEAYDEQQRMGNTRWLAGATKVLMDIYDRDPDEFYVALDELGTVGIEKGIIDPERWDPQQIDISRISDMHNSAMVGLGGQAIDPNAARYRTAPQRNLAERERLVELYGEDSPNVQTFDRYVRSPRVTDVAGVPTEIGAGGNTPLSTRQQELDFISDEARAREEGTRAGRPSTAVSEIDKKFAPEYIALTQGGGLTDAAKAVDQLDTVYRDLTSGEGDYSGLLISMQPRWLLAQTNPEALDAREQVEEIVQRNLRLILGAQFTEREGTRLIERAYNPALDEEYNAIRVGRLFDQIRTAAKFKLEMVRHYEQNGTLDGFQISAMPEMEDFYRSLQFQRGDVVDGYRFLGGDATNRANWQRVE